MNTPRAAAALSQIGHGFLELAAALDEPAPQQPPAGPPQRAPGYTEQQRQNPAMQQPPASQWQQPPPGNQWQAPPRQVQPPGGAARFCPCGQQLVRKQTSTGKPVDRCPSWRWNNGHPTPDHLSENVR